MLEIENMGKTTKEATIHENLESALRTLHPIWS